MIPAAVIDEQADPLVGRRGLAIAGGGMFIVSGHVQLEPGAEKVAEPLRKICAAVVVASGKIDQDPQSAGNSHELILAGGKDAAA